MRDNAGIFGQHYEPVPVPQRAPGILMATCIDLPEKLIVFRVSFVHFLPIDELQNRKRRKLRKPITHGTLFVRQIQGGHLEQPFIDKRFPALQPLEQIGYLPCPR